MHHKYNFSNYDYADQIKFKNYVTSGYLIGISTIWRGHWRILPVVDIIELVLNHQRMKTFKITEMRYVTCNI